MNDRAEKLLASAKGHIEKGEGYYRQAAQEIIAAQKADPALSNREIGAYFGRSNEWVRQIVQWSTTSKGTGSLPFSEPQGAVAQRHARSVLRDPDQRKQLLADLSPVERAEVIRDAVPPPERVALGRTRPTFIDYLVRINSALIELEAMVASWQNPSAIPAEFSRESFNDVVAKALRIQDKFDELAAAIDNEDEFQKIVRSFKVTSDVG